MLKRSNTPPAIVPKEVITLEEVLHEMENPVPFSITWSSHNSRNKTAGEYFTLDEAVKPNTKGIRKIKQKKTDPLFTREKRMVDHFANATRNIEEVGSGQLRTVSIWLILIFNNQRVIWYQHG